MSKSPRGRRAGAAQSHRSNHRPRQHQGQEAVRPTDAEKPGAVPSRHQVPLPPSGPGRPGAGGAGGRRHRHHGRDQGHGRLRPPRGGVLAPRGLRVVRHRRPGDHGALAEVLAALSVPAATLDTVGSPASVALPTRSGTAPSGKERTASRSSPTSAPSTAPTAPPSAGRWPWRCRGSGHSRTCRARTRRMPTTTRTRRRCRSTGRATPAPTSTSSPSRRPRTSRPVTATRPCRRRRRRRPP